MEAVRGKYHGAIPRGFSSGTLTVRVARDGTRRDIAARAPCACREVSMKLRPGLLGLALILVLTGCDLLDPFQCRGRCGSSVRSSTSLVSFLYPRGLAVPSANSVPQLNLPLRVGIA